MAAQTIEEINPALLFMPDISGFTEFVTGTELLHAQNIIQEVLEIIIDSNELGLEVAEIEGDAVFFYKIGNAPSLDKLLKQVQVMFERFHQHLRLYDLQRICPCPACRSAVDLKLKIIAHFGEVGGYAIKSYKKLFGKDIIIIHRLLKNNLPKKEYVLLTDSLIENAGTSPFIPDWYQPEAWEENYDVGNIVFHAIDLSPLKNSLPPLTVSGSNPLNDTTILFSEEANIPAPAEIVFGPIFDLNRRVEWMDGVEKVEIANKNLINRVGTKHRCILKEGNSRMVITEYAHLDSKKVTLIEMDEKRIAGYKYEIQMISEHQSKITISFIVRRNPFILAFVRLFLEKKMKQKTKSSLNNLNALCTRSQMSKQESNAEL